MSASSTGAIGPVSVRYAAQIRELLHAQAIQRLAADQAAARANAEAERAARVEAATKSHDTPPLDVKVETPEPTPAAKPVTLPEAPAEKPAATTGQIVDIQA